MNTKGSDEAILALVEVLRDDASSAAKRLTTPAVVSDHWALFADLNEYSKRWVHCLEGVVASILRRFSARDLQEEIPRYVNATTQALKLRSAVVDLAHDVARYDAAISVSGDADSQILWEGLSTSLRDFSQGDSYRNMRFSDKRKIIEFRMFLEEWKSQGSGRCDIAGSDSNIPRLCQRHARHQRAPEPDQERPQSAKHHSKLSRIGNQQRGRSPVSRDGLWSCTGAG